eukprot:gene9624-biopygen15236
MAQEGEHGRAARSAETGSALGLLGPSAGPECVECHTASSDIASHCETGIGHMEDCHCQNLHYRRHGIG